MMKRFARLAWLAVAVGASNGLLWTTLSGCGPDNNPTDGGPDSTSDSPAEAKADVVQDTGKDVVTDAGDGSAFDASKLLQFQKDFAAQYCVAIGKTCFAEQKDSGLPDASLTQCEAIITTQGGGIENAAYDLLDPTALNSGHISVDPTASASCLAGLSTMTLPKVPGSEYAVLAKNCTGALVGDIATGQGCHETAECASGFCTYDKDAGIPDGSTGLCVATGVTGANCGTGRGSGNEECMHRGWQGTTQLRCDLYNDVDSGPGTHKCTVKFGNTTPCFFEWECTSNTCDDTFTCNANTTSWTYLYAGQCPTYFPDAGLN
jgi:hypothetical protein